MIIRLDFAKLGFNGRSSELELLQDVYSRACKGTSEMVSWKRYFGTGKSTLVNRFAKEV